MTATDPRLAPTTEAGTHLDWLWGDLWEDLRHNATGRPTGLAIIALRRPQIEAEAARAALQSLRERVEGLPHGSSCALVVMNVGGCDCHLAAVLRLVDEALEP
jgi:hypothetical protein